MKPTHDDVSAYEKELAVLNEASMKYGHDATRAEIEDYLRNNGVKKYNIDFENSTSDALVFVNKQTNKATRCRYLVAGRERHSSQRQSCQRH